MSPLASEPSAGIHGTTDKFKVFRPNAVADTAKVIPLKGFDGFTNKEVVGVGLRLLWAIPELTVTLAVGAAQPDSTSIGSTRINFGPESSETLGFREASGILIRHGNQPSCVMGRAVHAAPSLLF